MDSSLKLVLVLLFLTTLFATVSRANMFPLNRLTLASSCSLLMQRKSSSTGLFSCQTLATPSANERFEQWPRLFVGRSQAIRGFFSSFDVTPRSSLESHQVWIQNAPAKEAEREEQRRQRDPNAQFTGALTSKTKADLQDIAQVLGLTTDGKKKDILARLNTHFDANPVLREDSRFEGIFNWARRRPAMQTEDEIDEASGGPSSVSSQLPTSLPPLLAPLSNIVNIHPFSYTSAQPTGKIPSSFFPPHQIHPPLPYNHPSSNINSHFQVHNNPHLMHNFI